MRRPPISTHTDTRLPYTTLCRSQRQEAIAEEMDDETIDEEAYKALDQEYDALSEEEHALHNIPPVLPDEIKPLVGAFLKLTPRGEMVLDTEYYSEEPVSIGGADENGEDDQDRKSKRLNSSH